MGGRTMVAGGLAALALGGAWAAVADTAPAPRKPAPTLTQFGSCRAFLAHVRRHAAAEVGAWGLGGEGVAYRAVAGDGAVAAPATSPAAAAPVEGRDFSGTNLQEAGVDEPDLVKTDGRTIFSLADGELRAVDVTGAAPRRLPAPELDGFYGTGLILAGDRLLVIGDAGGGGPMPVDVIASPAPGAAVASEVATLAPWRPATVIVQIDVSDPARARVLARLRVDGGLVAARRTGGTVRVVLSSSPTRLPLVAASAPGAAAERAATRANRRAVARAGAGAWLPRLTLRDAGAKRTVRRPAVGCRSVSRPTDYAGLGMIDVLTLGVREPLSVLDSDAVMSDGELVYASTDRMYVATTRWAEPAAGAEPPSSGTTLVHALDTSDPARTTYLGSGSLPGWLPNAYALSEQDGLLRAATTEDPPWWRPGTAGRSQSFVTVLAERQGRLQEVGRLGGLGRGERIQSARFLGDRAYVVTFRRTDPLFTIDLSDPAHPVARGELQIPGFSSYLYPVDADTLIGVGQAADASGVTQGTQVSLFDVSDPAAPRRIAQRTLDTDWSEAESEPHAFLWWPATSTLVLPAQSYGYHGRPAFLGAVGLNVTRGTGITPIARVRHPDQDGTWAPVRRALVIGDALYTVSDTGILASDLAGLGRRSWTALR